MQKTKGWRTISELKESWCFVNHGFYHLTIKIIEKDNKYCLTFKGPSRDTDGQMTIHTYELSGRPIRWLGELETLPHNQYKNLVGATKYGETDLEGIIGFLGVSIVNQIQ